MWVYLRFLWEEKEEGASPYPTVEDVINYYPPWIGPRLNDLERPFQHFHSVCLQAFTLGKNFRLHSPLRVL